MLDSTISAQIASETAKYVVEIATPSPTIINLSLPPTDSLATTLAAWAGASVSLLLLAFEIYKYVTDRPHLKITLSYEQEIVGVDSTGQTRNLAPKSTFWTVHIVNDGSKKITITRIGFEAKKGKDIILTASYEGPVEKFELEQGQDRTFTIDYKLIDPKKIKFVSVADTAGKNHKKRVIPS